MNKTDLANYCIKSNGVKLVPIEAGAAGDCAREGRSTGAGYYATVNARVADYPRVKWCADMLRDMCAEFPGLLNGRMDVNGGDLVDFMNGHADELRALCGYEEPPPALEVCTDCLQVVAGDTDCIDADREGEIIQHVNGYAESGYTLHPGAQVHEFSAVPCDLCGSKLAGERHEVHAIGGNHGK